MSPHSARNSLVGPREDLNTKMATKSTMHLAKASEFLSKKEKSLGTKVVENNALLAYLIFYNVSQMLGYVSTYTMPVSVYWLK